MARVSILIPAYNTERFIREALDSAFAQTYRDIEVIVVDDGSTDSTAAIVREYPQVKYILKEHSGISASRNLLVEKASGEYLTFLDSDDRMAPDKVEKQVRFLDEHPEEGIVFSLTKNFLDEEVKDPNPLQLETLNADVPKGLTASMIRRELFDTCGMFDTSYERGEDTDWILRVKAAGIPIDSRIEEELYFRRIHTTNITTSRPLDKAEYFKLIAAAVRKKK